MPSRTKAAYDAEAFTGTLLLHAFQGYQRALFARYAERGEDTLRPKHGAVIANIDPEGTRPSVLADRAGMTRPAMGELIDELESAGYVERIPDPEDRRAKLIKPTHKTLARQQLAREVNAELESTYVEVLGERRYHELRRALTELVSRTGTGDEISQPPA